MKLIYLLLFMGLALPVSAQQEVGVASVTDNEIADFNLYPNPALNDVVYITTRANAIKEIQVFDVFGTTMETG